MIINEYPFVSIVIPCRNEAAHIAQCLDSVLSFDYPKEKQEVLVVDGESDDYTPLILDEYHREHPFIKVLRNPARIIPVAVNTGIKAAIGEFVVRLDAHSTYPKDYVSRCVKLLLDTGAGNAGGRFVNVANGKGVWAEPVRLVTGHVFGVGNGAFRTGTQPGFVDTVPYGTFRRRIFDEVGFFDERLTRSEDNEFNDRLRRAGYKIAFDPGIEIYYRNQPSLRGLVKQAFYTGMWNVYALVLYPYTYKWRRFVPAVFVLYLFFLPYVCLADHPCVLWAFPALLYLVINICVSLVLSDGIALLWRIPIAFFSYHLLYGSGTIIGFIHVLTGKWKTHLGRPLP